MIRNLWVLFFLANASASNSNQPIRIHPVDTAKKAGEVVYSATKKALSNSSPQSGFDRVIGRVFDGADTNKDGRICFPECYELVLKVYIRLNRRGPINPPSQRAVRRLFHDKDANHNGAISRVEFTSLAHVLGRRAVYRLAAHKFVNMVCAPILAEYTVRQLRDKPWLPKIARVVVPRRFEKRMLPVVTSQSFGRTVLLVMFVSTLGNVVSGGVNWVLVKTLPDELDEV